MFRGAHLFLTSYSTVCATVASVATTGYFYVDYGSASRDCISSATRLPITSCDAPVSDVVIVGGGIVGTSLAMFLTASRDDFKFIYNDLQMKPLDSPHGKKLAVTLLERQTIASEATGLSAGTVYTSGLPKFSVPMSFSCIPTFRHISSLLYEHLQKNSDIEYTKCGCVQLATTPEELRFAKESYEKEAAIVSVPESVKFCGSLEEVKAVLPEASSNVLGAIHTPNSGQVNASLAAHKCAEIAEKNGAILRENVSVKKITKTDDLYSIEASDGEVFQAKAVVVAAGAWANDVLEENKVDVYKVKGQMSMSGTEANEGDFSKMPVVYWFESYCAWKDAHTIPHHMTHDKELRRITRHAYGKRSPDGRLFFGGDRFFPEHDSDYEVNPSIMADLFKKKIYPSLPSLSKFFSDDGGSWAGIMPFSKDGYATIDCVDDNGLYVATGFGASGIMDGPGATFFLADWVRGNKKHSFLRKFERRK